MSSITRSAANFILFQVAWLACVTGGASGRPWIGVTVVVVLAIWHLYRANQRGREALLLGAAAAFGMIFDSTLAMSELLVYASPVPSNFLAPIWIIALWIAFATTLNVSLRWLHGRHIMAALLGLVGGPLAYYAGSKLGGVTFTSPLESMTALALGWGIATPILVNLSMHLDGFEKPVDASEAAITPTGSR